MKILQEFITCLAFFGALAALLTFGYAMTPYQPGMHSESIYMMEPAR